MGAALFLNRMAQGYQTVSEIFHSMPQFVMIKDKIELESIDPQTALEKIEDEFMNAKADKTDGLKLSWENSWLHVRKSNTEPIMRIYAEAKDKGGVKKLIQRVKSIM